MGLVYLFRTFEAKLGVRDGVEIDTSERLDVGWNGREITRIEANKELHNGERINCIKINT